MLVPSDFVLTLSHDASRGTDVGMNMLEIGEGGLTERDFPESPWMEGSHLSKPSLKTGGFSDQSVIVEFC
jgi:hypothetical protein